MTTPAGPAPSGVTTAARSVSPPRSVTSIQRRPGFAVGRATPGELAWVAGPGAPRRAVTERGDPAPAGAASRTSAAAAASAPGILICASGGKTSDAVLQSPDAVDCDADDVVGPEGVLVGHEDARPRRQHGAHR